MSNDSVVNAGEPLVSVITRTKNRAILLERAMKSVLDQTYANWQHVVMNDGGERAALDVLEQTYGARYAGRLRMVHGETSVGMEAASNKAIRASSGELLIIHDDDDSWDPAFLRACVDELLEVRRKFPNARGIITHSVLIYEQLSESSVKIMGTRPFNHQIPGGILSLDKLLYFNMFPPISFLFGRAEWEALGGFRESLPVLGDWDFQLRYALQHDIWVIPKLLANYHQRPMATGVMGNTVVAGRSTHATYLQMLKNEWLRRDLNEGKFGPGAYVNLRWHLETIEQNSWNSSYSITFLFVALWRGLIRWASGPEKSILYQRFRQRVADRGWAEAFKSVITWVGRGG